MTAQATEQQAAVVLSRTEPRPMELHRDVYLDLLRGFCVFVMVVNHVGGASLIHILTLGNTFIVSAAEGFVVVSGLLFGMIYRKVIGREGLGHAARKALGRAGKLYLLTAVCSFCVALFGHLLGVGMPGPGASRPLELALAAAAFRHDFPGTGILAMYCLVIACMPPVLLLLSRGLTALALALSWLVWLAYQLAPGLAAWPFPALTLFPPAAWQLLFVHAAAAGYHRDRLGWAAAWARGLPGLLLLVVGVALVVDYSTGGLLLRLAGLDAGGLAYDALYDKNGQGLGRVLVSGLVLYTAYRAAAYWWEPLSRLAGPLLLPFGQHSLYAYVAHLPLVMLVSALLPAAYGPSPSALLLNTALEAAALGALWLLIRHRVLFRYFPH